jgi:hypothetical protein
VGSLKVLISDMKWLIRIGKWSLGLMAGAVMMVVPLSVTFFVHISHLVSEIDQVKLRLNANDRAVERLCATHEKFEDLVTKELRQMIDGKRVQP